MKVIHEKPTASITFNCENLKAFPLRSDTRQWCVLTPLLFNIVVNILARVIEQEKEIKGIQIRKEEVKPLLLADDIHRKSKRSHQKSIKIINKFSKVAGHRINKNYCVSTLQ